MADTGALRQACAQLVAVKSQLDDWLAEGDARGERRSLVGDGYSAWRRWQARQPSPYVSPGHFHDSPWRKVPEPCHFLATALPAADFQTVRFDRAHAGPDKRPRTEVESSLVVGGLWRRPFERDLRGDPRAVLAAINASGGAQYARVGDLPLYAAVEGKNRVSLAQREGLQVTAEVATAAFPEAGCLRLHRVHDEDTVAVAVSQVDGGEPQFLPLPQESTAVLAAYGDLWHRSVMGARERQQAALDAARERLIGWTLMP
ncbi:hypothetical protein P1S61_33145 [Streptomyces sp. ME08-AFT2]|uniref:hypothetical protein n=1 Tax=Streptomyces TaxID=1883 RepID=UPI00117C985E|nr:MULTISPECIES: hypothetical protein [Streptomyces]MDX2760262.1 hypothetical protein [Streptomyces europaeiscabiei]MDX3313834.1 hypothetical protein [Streptomyces sp. ME08-AFT2]MDX3632548.1 hypothetical protein [Streptomyces europaeiscabiei]MDX3646831.1 hypothetical protein [Streptomyces europaeiscabiei]